MELVFHTSELYINITVKTRQNTTINNSTAN